MIATVIIAAVACLAMILSILFFPKLRLGRLRLDTYWLITLLGALLLVLEVYAALLDVDRCREFSNTSFKIVYLFC